MDAYYFIFSNYIKFRCEPRRIARPHKAQNDRTDTRRRGLKVQEDTNI